MCRPGDKMRIAWTFLLFAYFSAKTNPETETLVLGHEKTETEFKIPQLPNTNSLVIKSLIYNPVLQLRLTNLEDVDLFVGMSLDTCETYLQVSSQWDAEELQTCS